MGQYAPETDSGRRLIAHELTHTLQQNARTSSGLHCMVQRQENDSPTSPITAQMIFPFPRGSRLLLNGLLPRLWLDMIASQDAQTAAMLQAIERQIATVTSAEDDTFEAIVSNPVTIPAQGSLPARTITGLTLSLRRQSAGTFDLVLSGQPNAASDPPLRFERTGLTATRTDGRIVLSSGTGAGSVPELRISPGGTADQTRIEAYTAPYVSALPNWLRGRVPERLELLQLTKLPDAPPGSAAEQQAVRTITAEAASQRREPRQRLLIGGGFQSGAVGIDPLLTASWQINFSPIRSVPFVRAPLELQVQYLPNSAV